MISVVCVYDNEKIFQNALLNSLEHQTVQFELIAINNKDKAYRSAAEALNYGGRQAKGDYIVFGHQDVWFGSNTWLEDVEKILESIPDFGIAGGAGMSENGKNQDERTRFAIHTFQQACWVNGGRNIRKPEQVQTLDEFLLIVPRPVFSRLQFDEKTFDGWHCYGADYCLSVAQLGLKAYVIPAFSSHHNSVGRNWDDLLKYQKRLYAKHRKSHKHIYTNVCDISWMELRVSSLRQFFKSVYSRLFPDFLITVSGEISDCDSALDLGCGYHSLIRLCNIPFTIGVDLYEPYLQESRRKAIHSQYVQADIRKLEFNPNSFCAVIAVDVLEHLAKEEGYQMIKKMKEWAINKVLVVIPNGYLRQDPSVYENNPLLEYRSNWSVDELARQGFKVYGINGWKRLRGCDGSIKYRPTFLWQIISDLSQKITFHYPKLAFHLMAINRIDKVCKK